MGRVAVRAVDGGFVGLVPEVAGIAGGPGATGIMVAAPPVPGSGGVVGIAAPGPIATEGPGTCAGAAGITGCGDGFAGGATLAGCIAIGEVGA